MAKTHLPVLVVDDDRDVRDGLKALLSADGYTVETAGNGRDALAALYAGLQPCAIVLDLDMPVMGGSEFRQEQLNHPQFAHIPVILFSAEADPQVAVHLRADAYIEKPADISQLVKLVERFC